MVAERVSVFKYFTSECAGLPNLNVGWAGYNASLLGVHNPSKIERLRVGGTLPCPFF